MKVKEIKELNLERLTELMTDRQWERLIDLKLNGNQLIDLMQESVRLGEMADMDEEYCTIDEYLDYIEGIREGDEL